MKLWPGRLRALQPLLQALNADSQACTLTTSAASHLCNQHQQHAQQAGQVSSGASSIAAARGSLPPREARAIARAAPQRVGCSEAAVAAVADTLPEPAGSTAAAAGGGAVVELPLAQTGEGIKECELVEWFVKVCFCVCAGRRIAPQQRRLRALPPPPPLTRADTHIHASTRTRTRTHSHKRHTTHPPTHPLTGGRPCGGV